MSAALSRRWPLLVAALVVAADSVSKALWNSVALFDGGVGGGPAIGSAPTARPWSSAEWVTPALGAATIAVGFVVLPRLRRFPARLGLALLLGGAIGNLLSLLGLARLLDPTDVGFGVPNLFSLRLGLVGVGNLADVATFLGALVFVAGLGLESPLSSLVRRLPRRALVVAGVSVLVVATWSSVWAGVCAQRVSRTGGYVLPAAAVRPVSS